VKLKSIKLSNYNTKTLNKLPKLKFPWNETVKNSYPTLDDKYHTITARTLQKNIY